MKQRSFRLDGLFTTREEYSDLPLYFVEVQFYQETDFYDRLFPSIFLFFSQYKPINPEWFAIVIFDRKSNDVAIPTRYQEIAQLRLQRIYLDEISQQEQFDIGIGILKLVVETEDKAGELARNLIERTKQEVKNNVNQKQLRELIETIIIYKFPKLSYEEIENMLNLQEIKETRVYQDAKAEGIQKGKREGIEEGMLRQKLAMIPLLQGLGLTIEQIAQRLEISEKLVRESIK
ncbi:Rpn family recombination-promoting nuclease/putative transposase [Xenococcus sp. PCC 7305]|uniref:Rpn family recombination-promoting nuclease/putative transposase n=1 Tax=Xenococcus sp. PCC 7305 TaxID=102125 RepID=UPI000A0634B2|nr:Rpn family recombination-promoting nuclease/putative transposase [Xenococcus sp. PCC 7305]